MSDASLRRRMLAHANPTTPEALARVHALGADDLATNLGAIGLDDGAIATVAEQWDAFRQSTEWVTLLAAMVSMVERERGHPDEPIPIWPDLLASGDAGRYLYLYLVALTSEGTSRFLRGRGGDERLLRDTWGIVREHRATFAGKFGTVGVDAGWWMLLVLRGELVRVGSLEFHFVSLGVGNLAPEPWYEEGDARRQGVGFRTGDASFGLHIPQGTDLSPWALEATLDEARRVLGALWPTNGRRLATCQSWMLDDRLREFLPATSNLLRFQDRFTYAPGWREDDEDVLEFVFRSPGTPLEQLDARTTLQRGVLRTLRSGAHWRAPTGWFDFDGIAG